MNLSNQERQTQILRDRVQPRPHRCLLRPLDIPLPSTPSTVTSNDKKKKKKQGFRQSGPVDAVVLHQGDHRRGPLDFFHCSGIELNNQGVRCLYRVLVRINIPNSPKPGCTNLNLFRLRVPICATLGYSYTTWSSENTRKDFWPLAGMELLLRPARCQTTSSSSDSCYMVPLAPLNYCLTRAYWSFTSQLLIPHIRTSCSKTRCPRIAAIWVRVARQAAGKMDWQVPTIFTVHTRVIFIRLQHWSVLTTTSPDPILNIKMFPFLRSGRFCRLAGDPRR